MYTSCFCVTKKLVYSKVMQYLRILLSGLSQGPPVKDMIELLGSDETMIRLYQGLENIKKWYFSPKNCHNVLWRILLLVLFVVFIVSKSYFSYEQPTIILSIKIYLSLVELLKICWFKHKAINENSGSCAMNFLDLFFTFNGNL